jgi:hypothetical protein
MGANVERVSQQALELAGAVQRLEQLVARFKLQAEAEPRAEAELELDEDLPLAA